MQRKLNPATIGDHTDRLFRAAWALCGNREDAEDLVQETYARVLARPRLVRRHDDLGYLLRALRNTFLSDRRTAARRPSAADMGDDWDPPDTRSGRSPEAAIEAREVFAAIATLAVDQREVLVAVDVVGLSYAEAAKALRIKEGTVMSRLYRARAAVAEALGGPRPR
ncbi:MAG: RNA polymerase sigma factor [Miltoncostaeaceae bacterium]